MRTKFFKIFFIVLVVALIGVSIIACSTDVSKHTIEFKVSEGGSWGYYSYVRTQGNEEIVLPEDPTMDGYVFYGWYKDQYYTQEFDETTYLNKELTEDIEVYAHFISESNVKSSYVVTFNTRGGNDLESYNCKFRSKLNNPIPTRSGYRFTGWYLDPTLTTPVDVRYYRVRSDVTLYAEWEEANCTVNYVLDGGVNSEDNVAEIAHGGTLNVSAPTKTGYAFLGWYLDKGFNTQYTNGTTIEDDITLYAKWTIVIYTISFNVPTGATFDSKGLNTYTVNDKLSFDDPTKVGYTFEGWFLDSNYTKRYYKNKTYGENLTLYALMYEIKYKINYHLESDAQNSSANLAYYRYFSTIHLENPSRPGCSFAGWYLDEDLHTELTENQNFHKDIDVYPSWNLITYSITYHNVVGSGITFDDEGFNSYTIETELNLPSPLKENMVFIGWYLDAELTQRFKSTDKYTQNLDLYAAYAESAMLDPHSYIEVANIPSLYYATEETKNVCIKYDEPVVVSGVTIAGRELTVGEDYIVDLDRLIISRDALNGMILDKKYLLEVSFESNDDLRYHIEIVDSLAPQFTVSDYVKFSSDDFIITPANAMSASSIKDVTIDGKDVEYSFVNDSIYVDSNILKKYDVGTHILRVYTSTGIFADSFLVVNNTYNYPYNVKVEVDSTWPDVYVTWDCDVETSLFIVKIDNVEYSTTSHPSRFSGNSFNATGLIFVKNQTVSVTSVVDNTEYKSANVITKLNLYDDNECTIKNSVVTPVLDQTFTVYGITGNFYITSWKEYYDFVFYTYLYRNVTNGNDILVVFDFEEEDFEKFDYTLKRNDGTDVYSGNAVNHSFYRNIDFVLSSFANMEYDLPEAGSYSLTCSLVSQDFYEGYGYVLKITYYGDMCPDNSDHVPDQTSERAAKNHKNSDYSMVHYGSGINRANYTFPIEDNNNGTALVNSSIELYMALEHGFVPVFENGSKLKTLYDTIKDTLKSILSEDMSDYEIALAVYDWICSTVVYDYASVKELEYYEGSPYYTNSSTYSEKYNEAYGWECYYIEGIFSENHYAVCNGIAALMSVMLNTMGIEAHKVTGLAGKSADKMGAHAWVEICIAGNWYYSDPTWGNIYSSNIPYDYEFIGYQYFLMTSSENDNRSSRFVKSKQSPFEINFANDVQFDIFKNINFEYNGVLYDNRITSQQEAQVLVNALVQSVSGAGVNSNEIVSVMYIADSSYSYNDVANYSLERITLVAQYRGYTIYILVMTKD